MTRRSRIWMVLALIFVLLNVGGTVYAGARGEVMHTGVHALLAFLGLLLVWWLSPRRLLR